MFEHISINRPVWMGFSALRNTVCKHIHFVVRMYQPVRGLTVNEGNTADVTGTASVTVNDSTVDVVSHSVCDNNDVPEVSVEAIAETKQVCPPDITESQAILNTFSDSQSYNYDPVSYTHLTLPTILRV